MSKKEQAQALRRQGKSHTEICLQLEVANSTLHRWIKDIPIEHTTALTFKNRKQSNLLRGNPKQSESFRAARLRYRQDGVDLYLSSPDFRNLTMLYWCEGTKNGELFGFCNTDPSLIKIVYNYLVGLGFESLITFDVTYHNDKTEQQIKSYWSNIIGKSLTFKSLVSKQAGESKRKNRHYGGMLSIKVQRVRLAQMMLGAIQHIRDYGVVR